MSKALASAIRTIMRSQRGIDFAVARGSSADAPKGVVVMVAGNGLCRDVIAPVSEHLVKSDLVALEVNLTGHGQSRKASPQDFVSSDYGKDVLSAIDAFKFANPTAQNLPFYALGHSMGSASLLMAAGQRPNTFASLFLFEPITHPPLSATGLAKVKNNALAKQARKRTRTFENIDAARRAWRNRGVFKTWCQDAFEGYLTGGLVRSNSDGASLLFTLACDPEWEASNYERDFSATWNQIANGALGSPFTLLFAAGSDTFENMPALTGFAVDTRDFMSKLADYAKAKELIEVADASHSFPMERPEQLARIFKEKILL